MELEEQERIETVFKKCLEELGIKNYESKTYFKYEYLFFNGAMASTKEVPLLWRVCIMTGRSILNERAKQQSAGE